MKKKKNNKFFSLRSQRVVLRRWKPKNLGFSSGGAARETKKRKREYKTKFQKNENQKQLRELDEDELMVLEGC
ncbi:hypothetical protein ES332_D02G166000v1 [Gossypium tomentosum]|uniref:Uncharacterized protein n=1 Tax=Gossypium tomentosum TaxID=34277 RepID=A0A5D2LY10_GOSTO|nr:hypothetical protein ES332_D02G166000v1 [Gossypium tomentosum]